MNLKKIFKKLYKILANTLPKNDMGDKIFSLILFIRAYKRIPNNKNLISNYFFKIKHITDSYSNLRAYISDKEFVKEYVAKKVGNNFNVPTYDIIHSFENSLNYQFPENCCIKPTHMSGEVIFRKNNEKIDFNLIEKWFSTNYYEIGREKNYRFLKPKLIIEPLIFNNHKNYDYKFFCFEGKSKFVQIDIDRHTDHTRLFFDRQWRELNFSILKPKSKINLKKPGNFESMIDLAEKLCEDFEFIRVDLYTDENQIYVGELTNCPENGNGYFLPKNSETIASNLLFNK
jgi:hypothetical protein